MSERAGGPDENGAVRRLRRFQERFEPVVTRVVLLGIFATGLVAQFVKPVGDALEGKAYLGGSLLSLVGYVLYDQVKQLSSSAAAPARALVNSSQLGSFVSEAFQARRVEISFLGYTGETLYHELHHRLQELVGNPGLTRRVLVRILVPDFSRPMIVPSRVGPDAEPLDDPGFRERLRERCQEFDETLSNLADQLTRTRGVAVQCEYRLYPGIPRDKVCILNREQVLHGLYDLSARMRLHRQGDEYYDPKGYRTDLNVWSREGTAAAQAAVSTWTKHFDDLWALAEKPHWPDRRPEPGSAAGDSGAAAGA